jgi:hypothetical protein
VPGGHHDNDNIDITKIKILPTEDEIRSDHPEFLPTTDINQPSFLSNPVERHLDTLFRLLHHDIFGEFKEALAGLMNVISDDPQLFDSSRLSLGDMRAYPYPKAHISYVSFNQKKGIEAHVSFNQLPALRKKSASDRRKWWEDSKRLEKGSEPLDFERLSPEGGCQLACDRRLIECGHKCLARCHSDRLHKVFKCPKPCQRLHTPYNHSCQKQTCGEDCGLCMVRLDNVHLPCNHLKDAVPCYQVQDLASIV